MSLSYNDYYTTSGNQDTWEVHLKPCTQKSTTYHAECIRAAQLIAEESSKQIVLMFSGGIDSEFMLNIFKEAQVDFKVAIISYGKWNKHDARYAFDYCKLHDIVPDIIDLDLEQFVTSGLIYEIAEQGHCSAYQMTSVMHGIKDIDGCIVMANCEPQIGKNHDGKWMWDEPERTNCYRHWYQYAGIEGTPDFTRYTPEQTVSFLQEPLVKQLVNNELEVTHTEKIKHLMYNQYFDQTPRTKYTGWEYLERYPMFNEVNSRFNEFRGKYNGDFQLPYNVVLDLLTGK